MTPRRAAAASFRSTHGHRVLDSVAGALFADDGDDWALLEAWVLAVTEVTCAALQATPEELHDLL